jgi:hypothetical protein
MSSMKKRIYSMSLNQLCALERTIANAKKALESDLSSLSYTYKEELALSAGVIDNSYHTVRYGTVTSYRGTAEIIVGKRRYKVIGHGPSGSPGFVSSQGYLEFIPLD